MASSTLSSLTAKTTPVAADLLYLDDTQDTSASPQGTSKSLTISNLSTYLASLSQTLTNKTFDTANNTFKLNGVAIAGVTGTGNIVFATSPTLTAPVISSIVNSGTLTLPTSTDTLVGRATTDTLTNKTLNSSTDVIGVSTLLSFNCPQGYMINGKISAAVASSNLTVALKTLSGADPSATSPVYINIGGTIRTVTAALSVTKNAGTNWCNAGASELATKEIDYFVYLGYNATDGVTIGFSRIPSALTYGDFSATSTNEKYAAISTITNAASTDSYENIGRFNAILSATASFNWSIPGTVVVINRPVFYTRWLTWVPTYAAASSMTFGSVSTAVAKYKLIDNCNHIAFSASGTTGGSASTAITVTLPISADTDNVYRNACTVDDTATLSGTINISPATTLNISRYDQGNYGLGAARAVRGAIFYPF